ncbi:MAG: VCBS repeat-containing protein, partial [Pseudomonadota bacterium]
MTTKRSKTAPLSSKLIGAASALVLAACATGASADTEEPPFTSIQPELFGVAGSLSNAWADYDDDGDLDFAVSIKGGEIRLYRNDEGVFVSVGGELGLPTSGDEIRGLSWGDYDGDGDADLIGGSNVAPIPTRSYVYRNDGDAFVEVAGEVGLVIPGRFSRQSNWIDYDNDGDLDLYAANRAGVNWLFKNEDGAFQRLGFGVGPTDPRRTVGSCWFDMDRDGDLDLFLANQNGDSDAVWRNDGARFIDIASDLGMDQTLRTLRDGGVGCAVGDYDNDGDFDLYVAVYGPNLLYRNNGDGSFSEVAQALGVAEPISTVGAAWADYDLDGDLDLMAIGYKRVDGVQEPLNLLYRNDGGAFVSVIAEDDPINAGDHGIEWIDYDNDGDVDLSLT